MDIQLQNISLLLRWLWRPNAVPNAMWSSMVLRIRVSNQQGVSRWNKGGSFFWKGLLKLLPIFAWSCVFQSEGIRWNWENSGLYSSKSFYHVIKTGGKERWPFPEIWHMRAPQSVKIFCYLVLQNRILTKEVLMIRQFNCHPDCVLCTSHQFETSLHLFFQCDYARRVWTVLAGWSGLNLIRLGDDVCETWKGTLRWFNLRDSSRQNNYLSLLVCTCWQIWLQRNNLIFRGIMVPPQVVAQKAWEVSKLWVAHCGNAGQK